MKIVIFILSVVATQSSASFYDEFNGAFFSVKSSVGKLVYDVVTDVRDTIDCTILAVKHVLSDKPSFGYNQKCNVEKTPDGAPPSYTQHNVKVYIRPLDSTLTQVTKNKETFKKDLLQVDSSVSKGNISQTQIKSNLENVYNPKEKPSHPTDVNILINKNVQDISGNVDEELQNIELEKQSNAPESKKVNENTDKILNGLTNTNGTSNDRTNEIVKLVEDSNNYKTDIKNPLEKWKDEQTTQSDDFKIITQDQSNTSDNEYPQTFKDVARQILKKKSPSTDQSQSNTRSTEISTESVILTTQKPDPIKKVSDSFPESEDDDYDSFFQLSHNDKDAVNQARKLIEESKRSELIMNSILKNSKYGGNLFDKPDLLSFG